MSKQGGHPEFVEGAVKPTHMFRQTQPDRTLFCLVIPTEEEESL